jgi:O-antigen/teichoic acid export membrane protein
MWALGTRVRWHEDAIPIPGTHGNELDPSSDAHGVVAKVIIDATLPRERHERYVKVVYPPVDLERFASAPPAERDRYLLAGAFAPYKRADLGLLACARLRRAVRVAGSGQQEGQLKRLAPAGTEFLGWLGDEGMPAAYAGARALLFPGEEDFGIMPVEAMAGGTPVIAYGRGGALETVGRGASAEALAEVAAGGVARVPGGVLFGTQTADGLAAAIERFERERFDPAELRAQAAPFAAAEFDRRFAEAFERAHAAWRPPAAPPRPAARSISANSAILLAAQVGIKLIGLALIVLIARSFPVEGYGRFFYAFTFAALFAPLIEFGMDYHVTRMAAREPNRAGEYLSGSMGTKTLLALVVVPLALAVAVALRHPPAMLALIAVALLAAWITALAGSYTAVFRAGQRMDLEARTLVAGRAGGLVLSGAAIAAGRGLIAVAAAQAAGALIMFGLAARAAGRRALGPVAGAARRLWRELLAGGLPFALTGICVLIYFRIDAVMLEHMKGERSVGIYGAATNLLFSAMLISQALVTSVFPVIARADSLRDPATRDVLRRALTLSLAASLPLALGTAAVAAPLMRTLYGERYAGGATALSLLMATLPLLFATNLFGHCLGARGRQRAVLAVAAANAVLNVGLNLWLIPRWDYDGAALATLVTEALGLSLFLLFLRRDLGGAIHGRGLLKVLGMNAVLALLLLAMRGQPWLLTVAAALVLYAVLLHLGGLVTPADLRAALRPLTGRRTP